jgi:hypothetical protein
MQVIGLLSSEEEANEIKFIAKVCTINSRIRFILNVAKLNESEFYFTSKKTACDK